MPISSCDDDRLKLAQEAESKFDQAKQLAKTGDHAGALEFYLFAFDNSLAVGGWGGVRLSYIPSEIANLGKKFPPALTALQIRRDAREELIRNGESDYDVVAEWLAINHYLHDKERELVLLKELEEKRILSPSLKKVIIDSNFERLMAEKNYDLLADYFDDFGSQFMNQIFHCEEARIFPDKNFRADKSQSMADYWKQHVIQEGTKVFELALGIDKTMQADEIAKRILLCSHDADAYNKLIAAAKRVGKKQKALELSKKAKANLDKDEYKKS
jgi:hypothetical protein